VLSLSLHPSGKILLALYDNSLLRLWDMTVARCVYKKKLGIEETSMSNKKNEDDGEEEEEDDLDDELKDDELNEFDRKPI
jgi:hypothetical protein